MLATVCGALYIVAVDVVVVVEEEEKVVVVVEELEAQVPRPRTNIHYFLHILLSVGALLSVHQYI